MSGDERRADPPPVGPPWTPEVLADFHAGALDADTTDRIRPLVLADPEAREVLAALDAADAELGEFGELTRDGGAADTRAAGDVAQMGIPTDVAARLDEALEHELHSRAQYQASVTELPTRPAPAQPVRQPDGHGARPVDLASRRRRRAGWTAALATAAAAVLGVAILGPMLTGGDDTSQQAGEAPPPSGSPSGPPPLALQGGEARLTPGQFSEVMRSDQLGALTEPERLLGCLQANGVDSGTPIGARSVTLDGTPAQLLILPAGAIGQFRLLTVGVDCGPGNPATISDTTFGS
ncbi:hypothetical protein GIY23_22470 [Allosaccharopolyspora coralli]|uniref:Anti-sigma factor n=1 Tax=Allosaccharopolyspora coralli TaxID=2665642 RepID=A0A5Q3QBG2_9PSEU|nr:hypothetical protein [Allosaccharopolyspora coralli]QGK71898.1 hypothetical protein GIY23_22470 [Allosaccharopolyspora coralli]